MSIDPNYPARNTSVHLPLALLSLAVALFFFAQIRATATQNSFLAFQIENSDKQAKDLESALTALGQRLTERAPVEAQIDQVRARAEAILSDVLELAKDDPDAKAIVERYGIQRAQPAPAAAGAVPAAGTAAPAAAPAATPAAR